MSLYKPGSPLEYDVRVSAPTMAAFHRSNAGIRGVLGPYGSGKSVGMCMEIFVRSSQQRAGGDGVRRHEGAPGAAGCLCCWPLLL